MIVLKSYCYSEQELKFVIAQLEEGYSFIDKYILYEFDVTHRGKQKPYRLVGMINEIPKHLRDKLDYRPVSIKHLTVETDDPVVAHNVNERIQRSYFLNDKRNTFKNHDIIIEVDVDEIIYKRSYHAILFLSRALRIPLSIKLNQFFYKINYLWRDKLFKSPVIYRYDAFFQRREILSSGFIISKNRDYPVYIPWSCGAHFSWVMSPKQMVRKLQSYAHSEYEQFADESILKEAISKKKYIFDEETNFEIEELGIADERIPKSMKDHVDA